MEVRDLGQDDEAVDETDYDPVDRADDIFDDKGHGRIEIAEQGAAHAENGDGHSALRPGRPNPEGAADEDSDDGAERGATRHPGISVIDIALRSHRSVKRRDIAQPPGRCDLLLEPVAVL